MSEWLTASELADRLRVTAETVQEWARRGLIPSVAISGKTIRFDPADVERVLRERGAKGRPCAQKRGRPAETNAERQAVLDKAGVKMDVAAPAPAQGEGAGKARRERLQ